MSVARKRYFAIGGLFAGAAEIFRRYRLARLALQRPQRAGVLFAPTLYPHRCKRRLAARPPPRN